MDHAWYDIILEYSALNNHYYTIDMSQILLISKRKSFFELSR